MVNSNKKKTSIGVIIISFILFFPAGIYFIHQRLTEDKTEILKNSRTVNVIGWVLVVLGIIYLLIGITGQHQSEDGESIAGILFIMVMLCLGGGLLTLRGAKNMKTRGERYNKYTHIINANQRSVERIANAAAVSAAVALKDLQEMVDIGFFPGAYIDLALQEVVLPGSRNKNQQVNFNEGIKEGNVNTPRRKAVHCPNCGAGNEVVEGNITKCEYCGSLIDYKD